MGHAGIDIDSTNKLLKTMRNNINEGSDAFDKLNISITNADGSMRSEEEIFKDAILTLSDMEDAQLRNALAQEIFGNGASELFPLFNQNSEAIEEQIDQFHDLNLMIDGEAVSAGAHLGDTLADIKASFGMIGTQLAIQILPLIQQVADFILEHMPEIQAVIGAIITVVGGLVQIIAVVVGKVLEAVATFIANVQSAWQSVT